jgi:hypothetical protein
MRAPGRYRAVVFHPGSRTLWRTGRAFDAPPTKDVPVLVGEKEPDPAEVIIERDFATQLFASVWARVWLQCLRNVRAEIHVSP